MHPKNTTAPPGAQDITLVSPLSDISGFEFWEVRVRYEDEGVTRTFPGVLEEKLAFELRDILQAEVSPAVVDVIWAGAEGRDYAWFEARHDKICDMIISVRTAERPGHEFLARLGQFGPNVGYGIQKTESQSVSQTLAGDRS